MDVKTSSDIFDKLHALARDLWWSWQPEVVSIFRDLDPIKFRKVDHNPVILLEDFSREELDRRATELMLNSRINWAYRRWQEYLASNQTWGATHTGLLGNQPVAYFSAEFGIHESLPNYSGGLGVLSGDHLKSASDLGVPLVAVGLLYQEGYFHQSVDSEGRQQESYHRINTDHLPVEVVRTDNGEEMMIAVQTRCGDIFARIWKVKVGRVSLFLLDTHVSQNTDENQRLTDRLYGGDQYKRIRQELLLGVGGARALHAMDITPSVVHMNEGHSAFAPLEYVRQLMHEDGRSYDDAVRDVSAMSVFTTHTPVAAGHDRFDAALIEEHVGPLGDMIGLDHNGIMGLGRVDPQNTEESFCMTVLAFKMSTCANAVSNLHGVVSRRMWSHLWPWKIEKEIPVGHITNGVHVPTWLAGQMRMLYDRVLPEGWSTRTGEPEVWSDFEKISPGELWETHQSLKNRLIQYARVNAATQAERRGEKPEQIERLQAALDPRILTIGFARRFAPYKRADLILRDLSEFRRIILDSERPVQFVFAGKSHPADENGKAILQRIFKLMQTPEFNGRVLFLEDYDINLARHLVQGVDVWLNNPRRPLEASGTSGQKVVLNGGLNCSILDGWWAEAFDGENGFAIGEGRSHANNDIQDERDAVALHDVLVNEVIPLYYDRDDDDLPQAWIQRMKRAVRTLGWRFNADRMVMDYVKSTYIPAAGGISCDLNSVH